MTKIDWNKPLELEDGTVVVLGRPITRPEYNLHLRRADGQPFTAAQASGGGQHQTARCWTPAGTRTYGTGMRVSNRPEVPADFGEDWVYYDGTNKPADDVRVEVFVRRHATGGTRSGVALLAHQWDWSLDGSGGDIIAYRLEQVATKHPQWAIDRMKELIGGTWGDEFNPYSDNREPTFVAFLDHIVAHEKEPVDRDLLEARAIVARANRGGAFGSVCSFVDAVEQGLEDDHIEVVVALEAIKRGRELVRA